MCVYDAEVEGVVTKDFEVIAPDGGCSSISARVLRIVANGHLSHP